MRLDLICFSIVADVSDKAPGPDGFTGAFYKSCWHIVKSTILDAFNCLYHLNTAPLERMNSAAITLIPKKETIEISDPLVLFTSLPN